jgi:hypothetical protein
MLIRIATFQTPPGDDRDWVIDALRSVAGVRAAYHAVDRETGALLSISVFEDLAAAEEARAAIARSAEARGHEGTPPDAIRFCEVIRSTERAARQQPGETRG